MLIITVIVVSFLRLMLSDQNQATNANLAESARNSALAGVEDAKRALLRYNEYCNTHSDAECSALATTISADVCNQAVRVGDVVSNDVESGGNGSQPGEIKVQQTYDSNDRLLDQAYTCVLLKLNTDDYIGVVGASATQIIPLVGADDFDRVTIEWFSRDDLGSGTTTVSLESTASSRLMQSTWPTTRPPVLRTQLIQFGDNFKLSDFDAMSGESSNTNSIFLYPTSNGTQTVQSFTARDVRSGGVGEQAPADAAIDTPLGVRCETSLSSGGYSCSATLVLPAPIGGGGRTAFLRLLPYYNATHYRVTLSSGASATPVKFNAVQPEIDSTGRANNVFKRVASRVDLYNIGSVFPNAAVDISGNFCKDFSVTDVEYIAGTCTP